MTYEKGVFSNLRYAVRGLHEAWLDGLYFRIGVLVAGLVLIVSYLLQVSRTDFAVIIMLIGVVLAAEMFNTILEKILNIVHPSHDARIGQIKDMSAAAVLIVGLSAVVVGVVVLFPYLKGYFLFN